MKTLFKYLLCGWALLLGSCQSILDKPPASEIDLPRYFQTANDAETLLIGCYARLFVNAGIYTDILFIGNRSSDDVVPIRAGADPFDDRNLLRPDDGGVRSVWQRAYFLLANINLGLERISAMPENVFLGSRKAQIIGELKALRAFTYFHLVRLYGGVPLLVRYPTAATSAGNAVARATEEQVYTLINEDLTAAETSVPATYQALGTQGLALSIPVIESKGRFTLASVRALQADVALTQRNFARVVEKADQVISSNLYQLTPDFRANFRGPRSTFNRDLSVYQNTPESIMEVQAIPGTDASGGQMFFFLDGFPPFFGVSAELSNFIYPDEGATPVQQADSIRKVWSVGIASPTIRYAIKYREFYFDGRYNNVYGIFGTPNPDNYHVFRLAEVLLFKAEALNETAYGNAQAFAAINQVRRRVLLPDLTPTNTPNQEAFRVAVRRERRVELFFEGGKRWFDILRYNRQTPGFARGILGAKLPNDNRLLLPIPLDEMRQNTAMVQNPGYSQ